MVVAVLSAVGLTAVVDADVVDEAAEGRRRPTRRTTTRSRNPTWRRMRSASSSRSAPWPSRPTRLLRCRLGSAREWTVPSPRRCRRGPGTWRSRQGWSGSPAQLPASGGGPRGPLCSSHRGRRLRTLSPHQFRGRRSGSVSDPRPGVRHRPLGAVIGRRGLLRTSAHQVRECRKPCRPSKFGTADSHSFMSFRRRPEKPLLSVLGRLRPASRPGAKHFHSANNWQSRC